MKYLGKMREYMGDEFAKCEPTLEQSAAMRIALEANQWDDAIAFWDQGSAYVVRGSAVHPRSKVAKIIASGMKLSRQDLMEREKADLADVLFGATPQNLAVPPTVIGEWQHKLVCSAAAKIADPYSAQRSREEMQPIAAMTFDHPLNVRARKIAALRESLSTKFEPRFPPEGRSCRVYEENRR